MNSFNTAEFEEVGVDAALMFDSVERWLLNCIEGVVFESLRLKFPIKKVNIFWLII